ncbi:hypothetical protein VW35_11195 [Devosia soli]|uniref:Uncharacterized protein n=1 Tax=Devosia soli TaxID=361041 RepID=A0A0F5L743_9HYPH|nr:hypothetical protein [Devosia soli]KKB78221.1 hypothetical protein VW35_11195 [Devosia soli]
MAKSKPKLTPKYIAEWPLPGSATLGSSVRARGIALEIRAKLPAAAKKHLDVSGTSLVLAMPEGLETEFNRASAVVAAQIGGVSDYPVIPREVEDILSIKTSERHRWLKDGRLPSAGTRTVKLRGRARKITFHVFDPRVIEDILNDDRIETWREEDAITKAENRRNALWKAKLKRAEARAASEKPKPGPEDAPRLAGWEEFEREGLLR